MPHVSEILGSSDVTRKAKARMINNILYRDTSGTYFAQCMPHVSEILKSGDVANHTKATMIAGISIRDKVDIYLARCMSYVPQLTADPRLADQTKAIMITCILRRYTQGEHHEIYKDFAIALLSHEQVTAESKTKIAALMLQKDSFKAHHTDILRMFPKLARTAGGGGGGTTDKTAGAAAPESRR